MDTDYQDITTSLDFLPEGAKAFLYQGPYDAALDTLSKEFSLTPEERNILSGTIIERLIGMTDEETEDGLLSGLGKTPEQTELLSRRVAELVLMPMVEYIRADEEDEAQRESLDREPVAPSPYELAARLEKSFSKPVTVAPTARNYSSQDIGGGVQQAGERSIRNLDPYRELPEEK